MLFPRGHEVEKLDRAGRGLKGSLDHHGLRQVAPRCGKYLPSRTQLPVTMVDRTQERGKTGSRRKIRPAQPINRARAGDQCGGLRIAQQGVILDARGGEWLRCSLSVFHDPFLSNSLVPQALSLSGTCWPAANTCQPPCILLRWEHQRPERSLVTVSGLDAVRSVLME